MSDYVQEEATGDVALQTFGDAAQRGIEAARARLGELGVDVHQADQGRGFEISAADRQTLSAEGMQATDRARAAMQSGDSGRPTSVDELAAVVEDLAANPWHTGPTRGTVNEWVSLQLEESHQVAGGSDAIAEEVDSIESRGVTRVVRQLDLDADRAQVAAAAAAPARSADVPGKAVGVEASSRIHSPGAPTPRTEAPQMRGADRFAGSRDVGRAPSASRGVER